MKYDAIIIGSGQAGFPLAGALTARGLKVALAEGGHVGGTCINTGCSPTKTVIASARAAYMAKRGADFGVMTGQIQIDFEKVMARKEAIVQRFRGGVEQSLTSNDNLTIYRHYAVFEAPKRVRVGEHVIEADNIYINTGARPFVPPTPGIEDIDYLDNTTILDLKAVPEHLIVVGGGYIGLEYAQAFRRFGSCVTIIERGEQIMGREDGDIAQAALDLLTEEDIHILLQTKIERVGKTDEGVAVTVKTGDDTQQILGSHLLMAVGRVPNSDALGLQQAGIATDERGYILVDDELQTNVPGIWALGDVNGRGAFTHTSYNDFEIVRDNLDGGKRKVSDRIPIYGVYVDPPLGRVGMSERDVRAEGRKALIGVKPMSHIARAIERDETHGLMKVIVDAETHQFLGAAVFGIGGDEIINSIADMMYAKAPYTVMKNAVHAHPTVAELLPTLLGELEPLE